MRSLNSGAMYEGLIKSRLQLSWEALPLGMLRTRYSLSTAVRFFSSPTTKL